MKKLLSIIVLAAMLLTALVAVFAADEYTSMSIADAIEAADGTKVQISGKVIYIDTPWNDNHGNITVTIQDNAGKTLQLFRLATKVVLGDIITVKGEMGTYNGNRQMAKGATAEITGHEDIVLTYNKMTIGAASAAADGTLVEISGTVTEIKYNWNDTNQNMSVTVEDEAGDSLYIYKLATKVELGDKVTVKGKMSTFSGARQIAEGATAEITGNDATVTTEAATTTTEAPEDFATPGGEKKGTLLETFEFGEKVTGAEVAHKDGSDVTEDTATFTSGVYTLKVEGFEKVYVGANDAKGNSALKLGTGSKVGKFSFTVPANVETVVIKIAAYKANTAKVEVNGKLYQITTKSNDGEYTELVVDTTTTKTVTVTTVSGGYRAMVDSIAYYGKAASATTTDATVTTATSSVTTGTPAATTKPTTKPSTPSTGDASVAIIVALAVASVGAVLTLKKKH